MHSTKNNLLVLHEDNHLIIVNKRPGDIVQRKLVEDGTHYWLSEEHKKEVSQRSKVMSKATSVCPHCGKSGQKIAMGRWHFDNCKHKPD